MSRLGGYPVAFQRLLPDAIDRVGAGFVALKTLFLPRKGFLLLKTYYFAIQKPDPHATETDGKANTSVKITPPFAF